MTPVIARVPPSGVFRIEDTDAHTDRWRMRDGRTDVER
jgi:hypothetical protein